MSAEAPIRAESREEVVYLLSQASELEHGLMCEYLFAMFSLKRQAKEGPSTDQLEAAGRWDRMISGVAAQEMLHLALVSNLLTAVGAVPHFERPNFPQQAKYYPPGVQLALVPFGERALRHFMYLERPEGFELADADGFGVVQAAAPITGDYAVVPFEEDYATVGHLYRGIEQGLERLVQRHGEQRVFVGPPDAQITGTFFRWNELIPVTDLASAKLAIETIVEQGEGARGDWRNAHFGRFHRILEEFLELKSKDPECGARPGRSFPLTSGHQPTSPTPYSSATRPPPASPTCSTAHTRCCCNCCSASSSTVMRRPRNSPCWPTPPRTPCSAYSNPSGTC